ncbi:hypothetical protein PFUGPA_01607 [Plasmodium falciparum Palo Alto/Uganda]|uniref:Uncharacterized protein n=4 Tax=Plasmodium falciparum TaxID=5833 RepID=W4J334_PLAFP|nr:hypothetical protein PFMALIP_03039 [Plasmodium falciparum MaliPS096_E11]ETW56434.1 hypothetical protein PFUGPA_01607 [Plasmodium falciparum Palo Alto/Uganda]ETW61162.1 hypothetical protein PFMC_03028 [Plasmodium falciparum CAMP/Malaysia]EUR55107.1 hypothetical protein PFBG_06048 [Plasmodium falciparum 7G8]
MMKCTYIYFFTFYIFTLVICNKETYITLNEYEKKNNFSVRVLKESSLNCGLEMDDEAEIEMRTFSPGVNIMPQILSDYQFGYAKQKFKVGDHNIAPLNKGLRGMCIGELRRIGISIGNIGKIYYEITLINYTKKYVPQNAEL